MKTKFLLEKTKLIIAKTTNISKVISKEIQWHNTRTKWKKRGRHAIIISQKIEKQSLVDIYGFNNSSNAINN